MNDNYDENNDKSSTLANKYKDLTTAIYCKYYDDNPICIVVLHTPPYKTSLHALLRYERYMYIKAPEVARE